MEGWELRIYLKNNDVRVPSFISSVRQSYPKFSVSGPFHLRFGDGSVIEQPCPQHSQVDGHRAIALAKRRSARSLRA